MPRSRTSAAARTIRVAALLGLAGGVLGGMAIASGLGAAYGVVLGPLLGWTLMRRVPLGLASGMSIGRVRVRAVLQQVAPRYHRYGIPRGNNQGHPADWGEHSSAKRHAPSMHAVHLSDAAGTCDTDRCNGACASKV
jgi:hypothetical protein